MDRARIKNIQKNWGTLKKLSVLPVVFEDLSVVSDFLTDIDYIIYFALDFILK
jgi:hypothetical protein